MEISTSFVGIDVSKQTLDVALALDATPKRVNTARFANTTQAFVPLLTWLQARSTAALHVCLEATGTYHDAVLAFLLEHGLCVSLLPSSRLREFRLSEGQRNKTDKQDAILLARYGQQKQPAAFVPVPSDLQWLRTQLARLRDLEKMHRQESNRLENSRMPETMCEQIRMHVQLLSQWEKEGCKQIRAWIKQQPPRQKAVELLRSIDGIGERTSWGLLSILGPDASRFSSAHQLVVYLGLDVARQDSGKRIKAGHLSKQGPSHLRQCLGMGAISAKRWDPDIARFAAELSGRGKKPLQVRVAIMRKLVHLAYGVLKHQKPYDPRLAWPTHEHRQQEELPAA